MRPLLLAVLLPALAAPTAAQGSVVYVDADAGSGGNGASWASAFRDLQAALAVAAPGDEVWIAEGLYKPTSGSDRTATFTLRNGVGLYGGFDGTETSRDQRDWAAHVSRLSGDIGVQGDSTDNAYHVITASWVDHTAVLDGLTVERGRANSTAAPNDRGAGLYAPNGSPTVRNARFRWNRASGGGIQRGGGIYVEGGAPLVEDTAFEGNTGAGAGLSASAASPVLRRVVFRDNGGTGAVMFAEGSTGVVEDALFELNRFQSVSVFASSPVFRRCTIRDNVPSLSGTNGAGVYIRDGGAPRFEDCLFERLRTRDDLTGGYGGAVYVDADGAATGPLFLRSTFRESTANAGGAAFVLAGTATFLFCRFERNVAFAGGAVYGYLSAVTVVGSTFVGNRAEPVPGAGYGGAFRLSYAWPGPERTLVASTLFAGNEARLGGAVTSVSTGTSEAVFVNVTFAGNRATEEGGAVYLEASPGHRFRNGVLWGDEAPVWPEVRVASGGAPVVSRAILSGGCPVGAPCTDVLNEDPLFVRSPSAGADGHWGTADDDYGDLRVGAGSPALDYGLSSYLPRDVWDLDGDGNTTEPLPLDVAGGARVRGSSVDVGAYERGGLRRGEADAEAAAVGEAVSLGVSPNPFRGEAAVTLVLRSPGEVEAAVYDVLGRRVAVLHAGPLEAGAHALRLDGAVLPAGVYVVRVETEGTMRTVRVTVVR